HHGSLEKLNKSSEYIDCSPHLNKPKMANGNDFLARMAGWLWLPVSASDPTWQKRIQHKAGGRRPPEDLASTRVSPRKATSLSGLTYCEADGLPIFFVAHHVRESL